MLFDIILIVAAFIAAAYTGPWIVWEKPGGWRTLRLLACGLGRPAVTFYNRGPK